MIAASLLSFSAALAAPSLYAPTVSELPRLDLGLGPALIARQDNLIPGLRASVASEPAAGWTLTGTVSGWFPSEPELFFTAGAGWRALERERLRLGPALMAVEHLGPSPLDHRITGRLGLALEAGGRRRFDLFLPVLGAQIFPAQSVETRLSALSVLDNLFATELGLSLDLGQRHTARLGLLGPMPMLSWRAELGSWHATAWAGSFGMASHAGLELGWGGLAR